MDKKELLKSKEERLKEIENEPFSRRTLSFYRYVALDDPKAMRDELFEELGKLNCLGRIYVAREGINAQMNVPEPNWEAFDTYLQSIPEFEGVPYKIAVEEKGSSFATLHIRVKEKIVADGLDDNSFDPGNTGAYLTAEEMNTMIDDPDAVVVDMRNGYESEIGHFENAVTPDVDTFREELQVVGDMLEDKKDKEIALYCTGGIRCEKASAWLKHKGFKNVRHLKGGIIDYAHQVKEKGLPNKFRGKNFVFDRRLGESVSDEIIATCHLCKNTPCDDYTHCKNQACHVLFIGCEGCLERKNGYCRYQCMLFDKLPRNIKRLWINFRKESDPGYFRKNRLRV